MSKKTDNESRASKRPIKPISTVDHPDATASGIFSPTRPKTPVSGRPGFMSPKPHMKGKGGGMGF